MKKAYNTSVSSHTECWYLSLLYSFDAGLLLL